MSEYQPQLASSILWLSVGRRLVVAPGSSGCQASLIHAAPPVPHVSASMPSYYVSPAMLPSRFALRRELACVNFACLRLRCPRSLYISVRITCVANDQPQEDHSFFNFFLFLFLSHYTTDDVSLSNTHKQNLVMWVLQWPISCWQKHRHTSWSRIITFIKLERNLVVRLSD